MKLNHTKIKILLSKAHKTGRDGNFNGTVE